MRKLALATAVLVGLAGCNSDDKTSEPSKPATAVGVPKVGRTMQVRNSLSGFKGLRSIEVGGETGAHAAEGQVIVRTLWPNTPRRRELAADNVCQAVIASGVEGIDRIAVLDRAERALARC